MREKISFVVAISLISIFFISSVFPNINASIVPNLIGKTYNEAVEILDASNLNFCIWTA